MRPDGIDSPSGETVEHAVESSLENLSRLTQHSSQVPREGTSLLRSTFILTSFSSLQLLVAFALQIVLASKFGAQSEMDAYLAASALSTLVTTAFLSSFNIVIVPVFIEYKEKAHDHEAWAIASTFLNLIALILATVVVVGMAAAPLIVRLLIPGFVPDTQLFNLTVVLLRLLLPTLLFSGIAGLLAGVAYAEQRFILPAIGALLNTLSIVIITLLFAPGLGIRSVAIGAVVGSVVYVGLVMPVIASHYELSFQIRHPAVVKMGKMMIPFVAAALIYKSNPVIDRFIASTLPQGSISYLGYAYRLVVVVVDVATKGLSIALFPLMSRYVAREDCHSLRIIVSRSIRFVVLAILPLVVGFSVMREPLIRLIYERGQFTSSATLATSQVLVAYSGAMLALSLGAIVSFVFYAMQDTATPVKVGLVGAFVHISGAVILSRYFSYAGPALAYSIATSFNLSLLVFILSQRLNGLDGRFILTMTGKALLAALVMGLIVWWLNSYVDVPSQQGVGFLLAKLIGLGLIGTSIYMGSAHMLHIEEVSFLLDRGRWEVKQLLCGVWPRHRSSQI